MKKLEVKKPRSLNIPPATVKRSTKKKVRLSKSDPDYFSKIGKISAEKRGLTSKDFSKLATLSHQKRKKSTYRGGRPKKNVDE